jgi:hypothetical protein
MTPADYIAFVAKQSSHDINDRQRAAALGLMAEAGEVAGLYERALRPASPGGPRRAGEGVSDCLY